MANEQQMLDQIQHLTDVVGELTEASISSQDGIRDLHEALNAVEAERDSAYRQVERLETEVIRLKAVIFDRSLEWERDRKELYRLRNMQTED